MLRETNFRDAFLDCLKAHGFRRILGILREAGVHVIIERYHLSGLILDLLFLHHPAKGMNGQVDKQE